MRSFNVLDPAECIFGKKVLEASAGTGKTFAIEHLVARLLKEAPQGEEPLALNQILVITFTRAAARELRMRIHATLKKRGLSFDGEQIFTIHGFCQKMVIRFGLEAGLFLFDQEPKPRVKFLTTLLKFLQTQEILCPEQLGILLSRRSPWELCRDLLEAPCPKVASSFSDTHKAS
jgi:ATP-dependent exoDNAse (exonuclease V) beta subunit